jgi:isopenicillin-N epimerase
MYSHHESIRLAAGRAGATVRKIALYDESAAAAEDEIVDRLRRALGPQTRVVGVTWVHSGTGVKLPLRVIATALAEHNTNRSDTDRVLLVVDGVHGFGVEDEAVATIGRDFFAAGTHKWILGPRGTGIIWGRAGRWADIQLTIPAFAKEPVVASMQDRPPGPTHAAWVTPGDSRHSSTSGRCRPRSPSTASSAARGWPSASTSSTPSAKTAWPP